MGRMPSLFDIHLKHWDIPNLKLPSRLIIPLPKASYMIILDKDENPKLGIWDGIGYTTKRLKKFWTIIGMLERTMTPITLPSITLQSIIMWYVLDIYYKDTMWQPSHHSYNGARLRHRMRKGVFFPWQVQTIIASDGHVSRSQIWPLDINP